MAWVIDQTTGIAYGNEVTVVQIQGDDVIVQDLAFPLNSSVIIPHHNDVIFVDEFFTIKHKRPKVIRQESADKMTPSRT